MRRRLVLGVAVSPVTAGGVRRSRQRLAADPSRVVTMLFVPGQEGFDLEEPRTSAVMARILALDDEEVGRSLEMSRPASDTVTATSSVLSVSTRTSWPIASIPECKLSEARRAVARCNVHERVRARRSGALQPQHGGPS